MKLFTFQLVTFLLTLFHFKAEDPAKHPPTTSPPIVQTLPDAFRVPEPVRYTLKASQNSVAVGEEITLTIGIQYVNVSPHALVTQLSDGVILKLVTPDAFIQTGGTYRDFIPVQVSSAHPYQEVTLTGKFSSVPAQNTFTLIKGDRFSQDLNKFIYKAKVEVLVTETRAESARAKNALLVSSDCSTYSFSDGQLLGSYNRPVYIRVIGGCWYVTIDSPTGSPMALDWLYGVANNNTWATGVTPIPSSLIATCFKQPGESCGGSSCDFTVTAGGGGTKACGSAVTLTTTCSGGDCSGMTYTWSGNGISGTGTSKTFTAPATAGTYTYTVTASKSGCTSKTATVTLTVSCGGGGSCNYTNNQLLGTAADKQIYVKVVGNCKYISFTPGGEAMALDWLYLLVQNGTWASGVTPLTSSEIPSCFKQPSETCSGGCTTPSAPVISASATSINAGQSSTLTATGCSGTVTWSTGATGTQLVVSPTVTTSYTATCTVGSCTSSNSNAVTVSVIPPSSDRLVVSVANITGQASTKKRVTIANPYSGSRTYLWYIYRESDMQYIANGPNTGSSNGVFDVDLASYNLTAGTVYRLYVGDTGDAGNTRHGYGTFTINATGGTSCNYTNNQLLGTAQGNSLYVKVVGNCKYISFTPGGEAMALDWLYILVQNGTWASGVTPLAASEIPTCFKQPGESCGGSSCDFTLGSITGGGAKSCGSSVTLAVPCSGADCQGVTYTWSGNGISGTGASKAFTAPSTAGTYTYTVTASKSGCTSKTASVTLTVSCSGGGSCNYTNNQLLGTAADKQIYVKVVGNCKYISFTPGGEAMALDWLYLMVQNGTWASGVTPLAASEIPSCFKQPNETCSGVGCTLTVAAGGGGDKTCGSSVTLTTSCTGNDCSGATYAWTGPNGFSSTQQNPTISNISTAQSGTYTVVVKKGDCTATASVVINAQCNPSSNTTFRTSSYITN